MTRYLIIFLIAFTGVGFAQNKVDNMQNLNKENQHNKLEQATFAGGCFWCTEAIFQRIKGVKEVESGYSGGSLKNPTYQEVCSGLTGHAEVIEIKFDPTVVPFQKLVEVFFATHDPTTMNRQGYDTGTQYRSAIFYNNNKLQQYCEVVINPKLEKFLKKYKELVKH